MKKAIMLFQIFAISLFFSSALDAAEVKVGDVCTVVTREATITLCPYPDCGFMLNLPRVPNGAKLTIEEIVEVGYGVGRAKWFGTTYEGKSGWVFERSTNKRKKRNKRNKPTRRVYR